MIRLFVFDLGKVILPFDLGPVVPALHAKSALRDTVTPEEMFRHFFDWATGIYIEFETGRMSAADFFRRMRERFCVEIEFEEFGRIWNSIFYEDGEVSGMVRALKAAGHTLYLLSNTNELHYGFIERNFPIVGVFDRHILSHRIGARKPEKRIYEEIFRHTDVPPHETLFIDDMEENIRGAVEMGLLTHHFTGAGGLRERLAAEGVKGI